MKERSTSPRDGRRRWGSLLRLPHGQEAAQLCESGHGLAVKCTVWTGGGLLKRSTTDTLRKERTWNQVKCSNGTKEGWKRGTKQKTPTLSSYKRNRQESRESNDQFTFEWPKTTHPKMETTGVDWRPWPAVYCLWGPPYLQTGHKQRETESHITLARITDNWSSWEADIRARKISRDTQQRCYIIT